MTAHLPHLAPLLVPAILMTMLMALLP